MEDYENNPDEGNGIFEIDSTIELGARSKKCVGMNLTQNEYPCFNKLLPICSTPKNPNMQLSENLIEMPSIEISHSENAISVNTITPPAQPVVNIPKISDKSTNIHCANQKNRRPKKKVLNWHHLHQKLLVCKNYDDLSFHCNQLVYIIPHIPDTFTGEFTVENDRIDHTAVYFVPRDIPQEFLLHHPVEILPDGNCFFRSLSWLVYGTEDKHIEMRSRIVIDSVMNFDKYTHHSYLMQNATNTHKKCIDICEYYCSYSGVTNVGKRDTHAQSIQFVLREDIMRIRFE